MKKWKCTVCGYVHEGEEPPEECPVCHADKSKFVEIVEEQATAKPAQPEPEKSAAQPQAAPAGADTEVAPTFAARMYEFIVEQIQRHHLHPIAVHSPNGILPMALVFLLIGVLLEAPTFGIAAWYSCIFVLLTMPVVIFTGYIVWQKRYRGSLTRNFKIKIGASIVTVILLLVLTIWRAVQPEILATPSTARWIYLACALVMVGVVGIAGHLGGKLVFGARKK